MATEREPLLVAEAGVACRAEPADPIAAWIELMEVVELLSPAPEPRPPRKLTDARL